MNTILRNSTRMGFHTDIHLIFQAFQGRQNEFNWLITNLECYPEEAFQSLENEPLWLSGKQLTEITGKQRIQFVWAVLSGFNSDIKIDLNNLEVQPLAEGHPSLWTAHPTIQHPNATVEIVCVDSSFTFLLSKDNDLSQRFRIFFPEAEDLNKYNI